MAGGPLLPSSIYVGGAGGNLSPTFYVPGTNTNAAGAIEGIGAVASLASTAPGVLQFNLPEVIPTGVMKLRALAWANATSGNGVIIPSDGQTAVGSNIGGTSLTTDATISLTWTTSDIIMEQKVNLATSPTPNNILTVLLNFSSSSWTLAATSVWQFSVVFE
jgi:hypothetical protein